MGKMERTGSGIRKMKDHMNEAGLKPPVFETDTFFRAYFYRDPKYSLKKPSPRGVEKGVDRVLENITPDQQEIVDLVGKNGSMTTKELAEKIGIAERNIRANIKRLKEVEIIIRVGTTKSGHWKVVKKGIR
jgi:ATP-dependent DNA helicase RecG